MNWLISMIIVVVAMGCSTPSKNNSLIAQVRNSDIKWDGTILGLQPIISGRTKHYMANMPKEEILPLIRALHCPKRFVAAHVALTHKYGDIVEAKGTWNGLHVFLFANGKTSVSIEDQSVLIRQWENWFAQHKPEGQS